MSHPDFNQRSTVPEWMDDQVVSFEEFHACLQELERINTLTLAYRPTLRWLDRLIPQGKPLSILDIGCGGGDMLRHIWRWAQKHGVKVDLVGVDINPWAKKSAELSASPDMLIRFETADIFSFDPAQRFDVIINSLFTHHIDNPHLPKFLMWMQSHATRGWFINDLHRHPVPYFFIKYAVRFLSANRLIKHDAPLSVARAFTKHDWEQLLAEATIPQTQTRIEWFFPFRYGISSQKP